MAVIYGLLYHHNVKKEDVPLLSRTVRERIEKVILTKIRMHPEIFGKPLRGSLKPYRSVRVGDYRIIFRLEKTTVIIVMVAHRSKVYEDVLGRLA